MTDIYDGKLGVSTSKKSAKKSFGGVIESIYPHAFCTMIYDPVNEEFVTTKKLDGSGSKPVLRLIYFLETGDSIIIIYDAFDAYAMSAGDAAAGGLVKIHIFGDTININKFNVPKSLIVDALKEGFVKVIELHRKFGIDVRFMGGETADLPIQVSSYTLDASLDARGDAAYAVKGNIEPGDVIFGMASDGQTTWEDKPNSGIGCNSLTLAGNVLFHSGYSEKYPFLTHPEEPYRGRFYIHDKPKVLGGMTMAEAVLSPTRQWAIVMKLIIDELKDRGQFHLLHGMAMNTGGAATKILGLGEYIHYRKKMPRPPGIFRLIQREGIVSWREMYKVCNNGVGIDIVGDPAGGHLQRALQAISRTYKIRLFKLGDCLKSRIRENTVHLKTPYGNFRYFGNK